MARTKRSTQPHNPKEDSLTRAVGVNLKRLRGDRGWSLDELAGRSGVSKAMLNQIELGKSVPTIAVLWRIADGLQVPFSELLSQPQSDPSTVLRREDAKILTNAAGTFSSRALFPFDGAPRSAEFYELTVKAGGVEKAAAHATGTVEHLALVRGALEVEVDGAVHRLREGDCIVFAADRPHSYRNPAAAGDAQLFLMMTYSLAARTH